jgi:hypothetical protein
MATPAERFSCARAVTVTELRTPTDGPSRPHSDRGDGVWVARRASNVGVVCVS